MLIEVTPTLSEAVAVIVTEVEVVGDAGEWVTETVGAVVSAPDVTVIVLLDVPVLEAESVTVHVAV